MAEGPFLCYKELIPSTSVEIADFFSAHHSLANSVDEYLFTATASTLGIYKVVRTTSRTAEAKESLVARLSLVLHRKIFGKPKCAAIYKYEESDGKREDLIILSLDNGKIVIFQYDPVDNQLYSILQCNTEEGALGLGSTGLHFDLPFDGAYLRQQPLGCGTMGCYLTVDNANALSCAVVSGEALLFTILPQSRGDNNNGEGEGEKRKRRLKMTAAADQFTIDIRSAPLSLVGPILDLCFVSGYSHPAVAVLQETGTVPIGHVSHVRHTCKVTVLAVDQLLQCCTVLWQQSFLPHDSLYFVHLDPFSDLHGTIALVTLNALLIVSQEVVCGIAMNGFAVISVSKHIQLTPWIEYEV